MKTYSFITKGRDNTIDILRSFALIAIILIHCHPDNIIIHQLTEFNVPMMVFLSGISYALSTKKETYGAYCLKRFKRLILPTWIFIWCYGIILSLISSNFMAKFIFFNSIFYTYWYVWIIRVFFLIALLAPLFKRYIDSINNLKLVIVQLSFIYICYELIIRFVNTESLLWDIFAQIIPYSMFFILGMVSMKMKERDFYILSIIGILMFSIIACYNYFTLHTFIVTSTFKYPPQIYYSSFAIAVISILWIIRKSIERIMKVIHGRISIFLQYIGSHTIWIYFWHIPVVEYFINTNSDIHYMVKFIIAMSFAVLFAFLQELLVHNLNISNNKVQKWLNVLFVG